ncbi:MAG TPA: hypothetical protein P5024_12690 [Burkholderiaceae bacterium]|jgi:hypothetical protein|nr:hypothetical protein [Burkholderiaceae bacterium]HRZ02409.1 hypothetical protein [Burkholderiaceae bacterium]HRZ60968.1 hypothetical protein [Rubrivivax sp.]
MLAIQRICRHIEAAPESPSAQALGRLVKALREDEPLRLAELYGLDRASFELALELLQEWRYERLYADRVEAFAQVQRLHAAGGAALLHA